MSRLLVAQRALTVPGWAKDALWRRAQAIPSLDLRFADNKSLVDAVTGASLITFTRASSGTFVGSDGVLRTAATDAPRFDHNPTTGESLGLLVEEQRTNSIRNNTMVGAVAGTPGTLPTNWSTANGGLTRSVVDVGTSNGINYIDIRFNGTSTGTSASISFGTNTEASVANGQTWTQSIYAAVVGGSAANLTSIGGGNNMWGSGGTVYLGELAGAVFPAVGTLGSTLARYTGAATIANASTTSLRPYLFISFNVGAVIDITLRIGLPQLEQGATVSSVIPTTTAAVTRSADVASITGTAFSGWYRQDEGTMFVDFNGTSIASGQFPRIIELNDETSSNLIRLQQYAANVVRVSVSTNGAGQFAADNGSVAVGIRGKVAFGSAFNDAALVTNGASPTVDTAYLTPVGLTQLSIGASPGGSTNALNSTIRRLTFWPQRLPNSTLQSLTQ